MGLRVRLIQTSVPTALPAFLPAFSGETRIYFLLVLIPVFIVGCNQPEEPTSLPADLLDGSGFVLIANTGETYPLETGEQLSLNEIEFDVIAIRPWSGLVRTGGGLPMASVSVRVGDAAWAENLFLADGVWVAVGDRVSLVLRWHDSTDEARAAAAEAFDPVAGARWGVDDGGAMQWLTSFEPGTGIELRDGSVVTLLSLGRQDEMPALEVSVRRGDAESKQIVTPESGAGEFIQFEVPGLREYVVRLHAWRDGAAFVRVHDAGKEPQATELRAGEALNAGPLRLRLEQVMRNATPVTPGESTVQEVVLESPNTRIRVREGEAVRHGDALLRFYAPEQKHNDPPEP